MPVMADEVDTIEETEAEKAMRKDRERKARRLEWEDSHTPDEVAAADALRLSMLRLKHRLGNLVQSARDWSRDSGRIKRQARNLKRTQKITHDRLMIQRMGNQRTREKVRAETRCVQIVHGFMRGTAYAEMEQICWTKPDWVRVNEIVEKLEPLASPTETARQAFWQRYEQWTQAATAHLLTSFKGYEPTKAEIADRLSRKRDKLDAAIAAQSR